MTPISVRFTGLEFDPASLDRVHHGVISPYWQRMEIEVSDDVTFPLNKVNHWLRHNIEGRWAIYYRIVASKRHLCLAFEHDFDAMTFMMAEGKTQAFATEI